LSTDDIIDEIEVVAQSEVNTAVGQVESLTAVDTAVRAGFRNPDDWPWYQTSEALTVFNSYKAAWATFLSAPSQGTFDSVIAAARAVIAAVEQKRSEVNSSDTASSGTNMALSRNLFDYAKAIDNAIQNI
jgi:uncharacterized protein YaiE (UPF0345 family)